MLSDCSAKSEKRKHYKEILSKIVFSEQLKTSNKISNILYSRLYGTNKIILSFFKIYNQNEIDLFPLNQMLAVNNQLALPRVNRITKKLECYLVEELQSLQPQPPYNIYEPNPELHVKVPVGMLDIILTPGLAFDMNFQRLGRGKGYYDRLIRESRIECSKKMKNLEVIAVGHLVQLSEELLPREDHDQSMDELILL